jgi:HtrA serine peptidase 2
MFTKSFLVKGFAMRRGIYASMRFSTRIARKPAPAVPLVVTDRKVTNESKSRIFLYLAAMSCVVVVALNCKSGQGSSSCEKRPLSGNFVADAVDVAAPAVVNIMTCKNGYLWSDIHAGSGFIISEDGLVVTNAHVVEDATDGKVLITTIDGKKRTGMVHSLDKSSDIALIQIDSKFSGEKFPIVEMGVSAKVRAGEFVAALGSPAQLQNSCSFGIISATARHACELGSKSKSAYLQTDAAINRGNSGGPLLNMAGQVIGINNMTVSGSQGISFSIPIDTAKKVIEQLRLHKRVIRPYVGLNLVNFLPGSDAPIEPNKQMKNTGKEKAVVNFFNTDPMQVLVQKVVPGSPADTCGIKP